MARPRRDAEYLAVTKALAKNRKAREAAAEQAERARAELVALLERGQDAGVSLTELARLAGISRQTAHALIREAPKRGRRSS